MLDLSIIVGMLSKPTLKVSNCYDFWYLRNDIDVDENFNNDGSLIIILFSFMWC